MKKNITVIIPCYNNQLTIERTIQSVLNQSVAVSEIIVLDDCSQDRSVEILYDLQNKNSIIQIIAHDKNHGPSHLRNKGIDLAKSKYVAFLDADDYWHKDKIKIFSNDPDVPFWASRYSRQPSQSTLSNEIIKISFLKQLLKNHVATPTAIINKEVIHERFDESIRYCEDYEYFTRLTYRHGLHLNQSILCTINQHRGLSNHSLKMRLGEVQMYFKTTSYCKMLIPFIPLLVAYSFAKHIFSLVNNYSEGRLDELK